MSAPQDPQPPAQPAGAPDTSKLYALCQQAEKNLEQIATGLGQIGAAPQAVRTISQMADVLRKICSGLAQNLKHEPAPGQNGAPHTMASATEAMMADHRAATAAQQQA